MSVDRVRVVQLVCSDRFAGVERYVAGLSTGLVDLGCDVTVLGGSPRRMPQELAAVPVEWASVVTPLDGMRQLLARRDVDVVHSHMTDADLAAVLTQPVVRAPVVSTRHFTATRGSSAAGRIAGRLVRNRVAAQIAISDAVGHAIEGAYTVVRSGVPTQPAPNERMREPMVLVAQRLEAEKRTDLALDIWQRSGLADLGWRLVIAGDGAQRLALEDHAQSIGAKACEFLGEQPGMGGLLARASILLAPCPVEALGLAVIEAMAMRVPVVAAAGGGHNETVGRASDAALFASGHVGEGARRLRELADDAARRVRYGAELAQIQQQELTLEMQARQTLDVYRSVLR